ncbi:MAG: NAD-dependent DNA ligase LigA [Lachnospiraceae bacterium]|jgi:DNA ligase (NAD+)
MNNDDKMKRMKELVEILNKAGKAYYSESGEIMSNFEYDRLYDELKQLEEQTGSVLSDSPTVHVGYETLSSLPKEAHEKPMLSLDKTKNVDELVSWLGSQEALLSWKMDGLTVVLTYENGELAKAVTRGNGLVGEIVTNNARVFKNLPLHIPFRGRLILRGEAIITYSDFNRINEELPETEAKYKNPRNLCAGAVRQLNNKITEQRNVRFYAFALVQADGVDFKNSREEQFKWLASLGFTVVGYKRVTGRTLPDAVKWFEKEIVNNDFPSDGLVLLLDDIAYGDSLGTTAKFPRNAIAFKWKDETADTTLRKVEWLASRTGLINPVAVFDEVELEGTKVKRASVHNVSIVQSLKLGIGDTIRVFKANMIIPQIAENLTGSGTLPIPDTCPVCGAKTVIHEEGDVRTLYCTNPDCQAKHVKSFANFASRDAMNIEGLSEKTLEKFIQSGFVHTFRDLYHLDRYREDIVAMKGFGDKFFENLMNAVENSRDTTITRVVYGFGIAGIGLATARLIVGAIGEEPEALMNASKEQLMAINGIGEATADAWIDFFKNPEKKKDFEDVLAEVHLKKEQSSRHESVSGKTFVITGGLEHFSNRSELRDLIVSMGGKVSGSVSGKTSYLINNDKASTSTKNRTAEKLGVPVISEEDFLKLAGREDLL